MDARAGDLSVAADRLQQAIAQVPVAREPARRVPAVPGMTGIAQPVLDSLPYETALIDRDGIVIAVNAAWQESALREESPCLPGTNYLDHLRGVKAKWSREAIEGIEAVLAGHLDDFEMEHEFNEEAGGTFSLRGRATHVARLRTDAGGAIVYLIDITWRKNLERQLSHRATHDSLTGLPNRMMLGDRLRAALARAAQSESQVAVVFCDIDRFKDINDTLGHAVGDRVLKTVADRLGRCCRRNDWLTRFGGDEFVLILEDVPDQKTAAEIAARIKDTITVPVVAGGRELYFGLSMGVALNAGTTRHVTEAIEGLVRDADTAMYRAKDLGRNRIEVFDIAMRERASSRLALLPDLHRAIERRQFVVHFQPLFAIDPTDADGAEPPERIIGAEALVRWMHPVRGLLAPMEFLATAEEGGLIPEMTTQVVDQSLLMLRQWLPLVPRNFAVSVNVSPLLLADPDLPVRVLQALRAARIAPHRLCAEVTESGIMENPDAALRTLRSLSDMGIRVAIDDFGTGHSSLAYLNGFPVDVLKIDRSFVAAIGTNTRADALVRGIVELSDALGLETIAEGVETMEQLQCLRRANATAFQGFLRSVALPPDGMTSLLQQRQGAAGG